MFIADDSYELGAHLYLDDVRHKKLEAISIFCEKKLRIFCRFNISHILWYIVNPYQTGTIDWCFSEKGKNIENYEKHAEILWQILLQIFKWMIQ